MLEGSGKTGVCTDYGKGAMTWRSACVTLRGAGMDAVGWPAECVVSRSAMGPWASDSIARACCEGSCGKLASAQAPAALEGLRAGNLEAAISGAMESNDGQLGFGSLTV